MVKTNRYLSAQNFLKLYWQGNDKFESILGVNADALLKKL